MFGFSFTFGRGPILDNRRSYKAEALQVACVALRIVMLGIDLPTEDRPLLDIARALEKPARTYLAPRTVLPTTSLWRFPA